MEEGRIDLSNLSSGEIRSKIVELADREVSDGLSEVDRELYELLHGNSEDSKSFWTTSLQSDYHLSAEGFDDDKSYKDAKPEVQVKKLRQLYLNISKCLIGLNAALEKMETDEDVVRRGNLYNLICQYNVPRALHRYIVWKPDGKLPCDFELLTEEQCGIVTGKVRSSEELGVVSLCDVWFWKNTAPDWFPDPKTEKRELIMNRFIYSSWSVQVSNPKDGSKK